MDISRKKVAAKRDTTYSKRWEEKEECRDWLTKGPTSSEARCRLCDVNFSIKNRGITAVLQHAKGGKHKERGDRSRGQRTLMGSNAAGSLMLDTRPSSFSHTEQVARAEILWLMRMIRHNQSFKSMDDLIPTMKTSLVDDKNHLLKDMSLGASKVSYSITYGLGPFCHDLLLKEMGELFFTIMIDEATPSSPSRPT